MDTSVRVILPDGKRHDFYIHPYERILRLKIKIAKLTKKNPLDLNLRVNGTILENDTTIEELLPIKYSVYVSFILPLEAIRELPVASLIPSHSATSTYPIRGSNIIHDYYRCN